MGARQRPVDQRIRITAVKRKTRSASSIDRVFLLSVNVARLAPSAKDAQQQQKQIDEIQIQPQRAHHGDAGM